MIQRVHKPQRGDLVRSLTLAKELTTREPLTVAHWFNADDDEQRYLGVYRADESGSTKGNLLILHDSRQHPDWPGTVRALRQQMAKHGWHTLSIALPDYWPIHQIPERQFPAPTPPNAEAGDPETASATTAATPTPEPEPTPDTPSEPTPEPTAQRVWQQREVEVAPADYPDAFADRVQAGLGYLREQANLPVVVVSVGTSASWFTAFLAANPGSVQGLVIIDLAEPPHADMVLNDLLPQLTLPILDLIPERSSRHDPILRQTVMQRAQRNHYEQRYFPGVLTDTAATGKWIVRAVRGWTERQMNPGRN